jgi:hypothetical protein
MKKHGDKHIMNNNIYGAKTFDDLRLLCMLDELYDLEYNRG